MKNRFLALVALAFVSASCIEETDITTSAAQDGGTSVTKLVGLSDGEISPGTLLIKLDRKSTDRICSGDLAAVSGLLNGTEVTGIAPALAVAPKNREAAKRYGLDQWYAISFDKSINPQTVAARIAESPIVRAVQYDRREIPVTSPKVIPFNEKPITRLSEPSPYPFDDKYIKYQWNLINDGTITERAIAGADVNVKDAWKLTCGDPSVIVAVIDDAISYMHEDLKEAMWVNQEEKDGEINVDDDGNGYIDDRYGFNFVGQFSINDEWINGKIDGNVTAAIKGNALTATKGSGHGTHVAGIIGAVNGNGKGVSSIAGGDYANGKQGVRLMSCQIFEGSANGGTDAMKAAAYIYAADNGACIAQCSYGNSAIITSDDMYINGNGDDLDGSPLEYAALKYFLDPDNSNHESLEGNIAVFAAGNHANPYSIYPGALPFCISVTAHDCSFLPSGYSNYGPGCKICAPGGEFTGIDGQYEELILSTGVEKAETYQPGIKDGDTENRHYVYMYGTSMACPHVSGVLALGISYARQLGKTFTREEMTSMLLTTANNMDGRLKSGTKRYYDIAKESYVELPLEQYYKKMGTGTVDVWKFLMAIEGTPVVTAKTGETTRIDMSEYCNPSLDYKICINEASASSLGIAGNPTISNGVLEVICGNVGSGKITLTGAIGKDSQKEDGIGSMGFSREISIVSRPFAAENGGWL